MAIKRRGLLLGSTALWLGAPAILRAQTQQASQKINVSHGFAMHGAPKYAADTGPPEFLNPSAPKGGSVRLGARGTFNSLHPFIIKSVPAAGVAAIWDTLCWASRDEASTEYGLIAETIEWPEDRAWVAFTLRPQARFHDGTPITVEDVIWTFDTLKAKGLPNYAFYYGDVLKAEKTGDRKVLFTFRDNTNKELPLILGQLPVLPSKWWATRDFEKVSLEIPLGSGAYKVDSFDVGRSIAYRRVDDWWAKDLWMNKRAQQLRGDALRVLSRRHRAVRGLQGRRDRHPPGEHRAQLGNRLRHPRRARRPHPARRDPARAADRHAVLRLQHAARLLQGHAGARGDRHHVRLRLDQQEPVLRDVQAQHLVLRQLRARLVGPADAGRAEGTSSRCAARSPTRSSPRSSSCPRATARATCATSRAARWRS